MLLKEKVLETINSMPKEFTIDEVMERLIIIEKIQKGLQQVAEGKTVSTEEAKRKLNKWLK